MAWRFVLAGVFLGWAVDGILLALGWQPSPWARSWSNVAVALGFFFLFLSSGIGSRERNG